MLARILAAAAILLAVLASGDAVKAQTPTPESVTPTATPVAEKTPLPATTTPQPATPLPESEKPMALVGYVIEDTDGNGVRSAGDRPAQTLVQLTLTSEGRLYGEGTRLATLLTDDSGRFEIDDLLPGEYEFTAWWMPGFIGAQGTLLPEEVLTLPSYTAEGTPVVQFAHMLRLKVTVMSDGIKTYRYAMNERVDGGFRLRDVENAPPIPSGDLVVLGRLKPEGLYPYPVSTGDGGPIPVGKVSFAQVSMPSSGDGGTDTGLSFGWWFVMAGVILLVATTVFLRVEKRLRRR